MPASRSIAALCTMFITAAVAAGCDGELEAEKSSQELSADGFPELMVFNVPPSCGTNPRVCCGYPVGYCQLRADLKERPGDLPRVEVEPLDDQGTRYRVIIRARIRTPKALPTATRWLLGWVDCNVYVDSTWAGWEHIKIEFQLAFLPDAESGFRVKVEKPNVSGLTGSDIDIYGDWLCKRADRDEAAWKLMSTFRDRLPAAVEQMLCKKCATDADCGSGATCKGPANDRVCYLPSGRCLQSFGRSV